MFKPGDKVKALVSHKNMYEKGNIYTVIKLNNHCLYLKEVNGSCSPSRFELYKEEVIPPAVKKTAAEEWGF